MAQKKINSVEEKELIEHVFDKIKKSTTSEELRHYRENCIKEKTGILFDDKKYPKIMFKISPEEILRIKDTEINTEKIKDPLAKLLYAMAWKQGDIPKLKHIIEGVLKSGEDQIIQDNALVFYQFGKHLAKPESEPIVDVNILTAFSVYKSLKNTPKMQKENISKYKIWLSSNELKDELKADKEYHYEIDKLLFVTGKAIKLSKEKSNT